MDMNENLLSKIDTCWRGHHDFAVWLVNEVRPDITVDLGVYHGYSTFCFAEPGIGIVYGIDNFETAGGYEDCLKNRLELGCENVHIVKGDFDKVYEQFKIINETYGGYGIDILHIDGEHSIEAVRNDFDKWSTLVKDSGIILLHDVLHACFDGPMDLMTKETKNYNGTIMDGDSGLGILTKNDALFNKIANKFSLVKIIDIQYERMSETEIALKVSI